MGAAASIVGARWEPAGHPRYRPDELRVVAAGPCLPPTAVVLHATPLGGTHTAPPDRTGAGGAEFADEHLVADAVEGNPWSQVADVLIVRGVPGRIVVRRAFPGWLVAVFIGPGREHLLEVATGWLARLVPLSPDTNDTLWPYASFVHAWATAGRPLDALHDARLTTGRDGVRVIVVEDSTAWPAAA